MNWKKVRFFPDYEISLSTNGAIVRKALDSKDFKNSSPGQVIHKDISRDSYELWRDGKKTRIIASKLVRDNFNDDKSSSATNYIATSR